LELFKNAKKECFSEDAHTVQYQ